MYRPFDLSTPKSNIGNCKNIDIYAECQDVQMLLKQYNHQSDKVKEVSF